MATGVYSNDDTELKLRMCPACGFKGALRRLVVKDEDFWRKSDCTKKEADSISPNNTFIFNTCVACGFQWMPMEEHLTTSRLRSYLITRTIECLEQSTPQNLDMVVKGIYEIFGMTPTFPPTVRDEDYIRWETLTDVVDQLRVFSGEEMLTCFNLMNGKTVEPEALPPVIEDETSRTIEVAGVLQND